MAAKSRVFARDAKVHFLDPNAARSVAAGLPLEEVDAPVLNDGTPGLLIGGRGRLAHHLEGRLPNARLAFRERMVEVTRTEEASKRQTLVRLHAATHCAFAQGAFSAAYPSGLTAGMASLGPRSMARSKAGRSMVAASQTVERPMSVASSTACSKA